MFYHPTSLTTVKILENNYTKYKVLQLQDKKSISLQTLVNRSIYLYLTDDNFRKILDNTKDLVPSGSLL